MKNKKIATGLMCVLGTCASVSMASPTLFLTSGTTMYRIQLDAPQGGAAFTQFDQFDLGVELVSLTADDQGRLWGTEVIDTNGNGNYALYSMDQVLGVPAMTLEGDFLAQRTSSIVWSQGSLYGFVHPGDQMIAIDYVNDASTAVGSLAEGTFLTSSGWDNTTGAFYGIDINNLYRYDNSESGFVSSLVTELDFGVSGTSGGEVIEGIYYHAINDGEVMHIYSIDLLTGETLELINFEVDGRASVGLAGVSNVPSPGSLALLGAGGLIGMRRRR